MQNYKRNAFIYSTIVAMGGLVFGLDAALISGTVNFLQAEFGLNDIQLGVAVSAPGLGVLLALPFAGYASDYFGRKNSLLVIAALYLISAIGSTFAPGFVSLVAFRFLGGLAFSSITLASMYIGEIAPSDMRGKLVSMTQINIVIGLSAAYFINYLILQATGSDAEWVTSIGLKTNTWRWMLGSEILPAFAWLCLLLMIPRSPAWLVAKNRIEEAKLTLTKLIPTAEIENQIIAMQLSLAQNQENNSFKDQIRKIFSKKLRIVLIVGVTIAIAQQATGINAILFYAPTVFEQLGMGTDAAFMQAIWIGLTSIVFTIASLLLIDRIGRRPMIIWGMVWIILSLGICWYGFSEATYTLGEDAVAQLKEIPNAERLSGIIGTTYGSDLELKAALTNALGEEDARTFSGALLQKSAKMNALLILIGILSFIAAFHFSVGPIMWVLFSELFDISIRGTAIPLFALLTSLVSYLVQQFFPWQLANLGISSTFLFYASMVTIGLLILAKFLPETKNLSIEEIQAKIAR